jgi:peptidoglycan/xylan/chitin deacetylase (PgdA/CDA1 family)
MKRILGSSMLRTLTVADDRSLARILRASLGERCLALCFHRIVATRRDGELLPKLSMPAAEVDRLLRFLVDAAHRPDRWLTVSFDDGYRDAADYVLARAPRFPGVDWLFFLCPQKTERKVGFRWDLAETRRRLHPALDTDGLIFAPVDLSLENLRADLRRLAADARFALADVDVCRRIQRLPNAALGNHTNVHHRQVLLDLDRCRDEYRRSTEDFRRLFGELRHFAFPFGVPELDFAGEHVEALRRIGGLEIWSTEPRPYDASERGEGSVLPRFAVDGTRTWKESVAHIILQSIRSRLRRREDLYPRLATAAAAVQDVDRP